MITTRNWLMIAAGLGLVGVALGAFGAHGLAATLTANGRADTFETANRYHLMHTFALIAAAWLRSQRLSTRGVRWVNLAAGLFIVGISLFSGSLYLLAILNLGLMGAIAPLGGAALIGGWLCFGLAAHTLGEN